MLSLQLRPSVNSSVTSFTSVNSMIASRRTTLCPIVLSNAVSSRARGYWNCRKGLDYSSHLDPMFHRFTRYRTLKTRAKLLEKLRRREKWDIDAGRSFFTPRHIRLASHWNGNGRSRWARCVENDKSKHDKEEEPNEGENGYELSRREREWKEQMEKMRRRIEKDPYEAIFGKRLEPFWGPLVPTWMREDMGLRGWPKSKETGSDASVEPKAEQKQTSNHSPGPTTASPVVEQAAKKEGDIDTNDGPPNGQLTSYSYASSTSWDSGTRKTKRSEWDSITGKTRLYEYDPISNRMVKVSAPEATVELENSKKVPDVRPIDVESSPSVPAINIPVKTTDYVRKAIHVPTEVLPKTSLYFPSLLNTSHAPKISKSTVHQHNEQNLDSLTADQIRASVGKSKLERSDVSDPQMEETRRARQKIDLTRSEWDRAETRYMLDRELDGLNQQKDRLLKQEQGLFHIGKQQKDISALNAKIANVTQQMEDLDAIQSSVNPLNDFEYFKQTLSLNPKSTTVSTITSPQVTDQKPTTAPSRTLQTSMERMQHGQLDEAVELDDSAAHESTGDPIAKRVSNIPKGWDEQADTLQAERIQRTHGNSTKQKLEVPRWIDDMNARKAKYDAVKLVTQSVPIHQVDKQQKASKILEAEVKQQKLYMQGYENRHTRQPTSQTVAKDNSKTAERADVVSAEERYIQKNRALKKELDTAFKQSSIQAEMQVETIRKLERQLERLQKEQKSSDEAVVSAERKRYGQKIQTLRQELDVAYKQSSINAEMQVEWIRALEKELGEVRNPQKSVGIDTVANKNFHGEGDFCPNVTKYAKDSARWYKQSTSTPTATEPSQLDNIVPKMTDRVLVETVRDIYEKRYGSIDYDHVQVIQTTEPEKSTAQVFQAESDANLGKALSKFEDVEAYQFKDDNLAQELMIEETDADKDNLEDMMGKDFPRRYSHKSNILDEAQSLSSQDKVANSSVIINNSGATENTVTKASRSESSDAADTAPVEHGIQWAEPPVYKILAYDSGNDMFSTATTSSNFTGKESPISIQQALSQLYQPARFVSHFSELQKENFQVVYATKDLLVCKQVKTSPKATTGKDTDHADTATLQDHGLLNVATKRQPPRIYPGINPIDGTSFPPPEKPSTGDFASPTGFVGDRVETLESSFRSSSSSSSISEKRSPPTPTSSRPSPRQELSEEEEDDANTDYVHYPRIKREERVFSGGRLHGRRRAKDSDPASSSTTTTTTTTSSSTLLRGERRPKKWRKYRSRMRWAVGVGIGAAAVAYGIGAAAERKGKGGKSERWEEILEGKRSRWE